jgi:hypothetical protein
MAKKKTNTKEDLCNTLLPKLMSDEVNILHEGILEKAGEQ